MSAKGSTPTSSPLPHGQVGSNIVQRRPVDGGLPQSAQLYRRSKSQPTLQPAQQTQQPLAIGARALPNRLASPGCDEDGGASSDAAARSPLRRRSGGAKAKRSPAGGLGGISGTTPIRDGKYQAGHRTSCNDVVTEATVDASQPSPSVVARRASSVALATCASGSDSEDRCRDTGARRELSFAAHNAEQAQESEPETELRLPAGRPSCSPFGGGEVLAEAAGEATRCEAAAGFEFGVVSVGNDAVITSAAGEGTDGGAALDSKKAPSCLLAGTGLQHSACLTPVRDFTAAAPYSATPSTGTPPTSSQAKGTGPTPVAGPPSWLFNTPQCEHAGERETPHDGSTATPGSVDFSPHLPLPSATLLLRDSPTDTADCSTNCDGGADNAPMDLPLRALLAGQASLVQSMAIEHSCMGVENSGRSGLMTAVPPALKPEATALTNNAPEIDRERTPLGQLRSPLSSSNAAGWPTCGIALAVAKTSEGTSGVSGPATHRSVGGSQRRAGPATPATMAALPAASTPGSAAFSGAASALRPTKSSGPGSASRRGNAASGECSIGGGAAGTGGSSSCSKTPRYLQSTMSWALKHG